MGTSMLSRSASAALTLLSLAGAADAHIARARQPERAHSAGETLRAAAEPGERVGAGMLGVRDWSRDMAFIDLVRQARTWGSPSEPWNSAQAPAVDADGWPTDDFGVVLMTDMAGVSGTGGTYRIQFECAALPVVDEVASPGRVRSVSRNPATGIVTALYDFPEGGEQMMLSFRFTAGGVRNLEVLRPGSHAHPEFTDPFVDHVSRFAALRFMDWTGTNNHPVGAWNERTQPADVSYAGGTGAPWEACIDLCNAAGTDLWVNVPHMADDQYVRSLAQLIHHRLDPDLNVYVEYSNEVWNGVFSQANWNLSEAVREVNEEGAQYDYDGSTNTFYWSWRRIAEQTKRLGDIFRDEFGASAMMTRVRPVFAAQIAWPEQYREGMRYLQAVHGDPAQYVYGLAGAPYFNMQGADADPHLTPDDVLDALGSGIDYWSAGREMEFVAAQAAYFGVGFMAYEGGPDTFGPNNIDAKRDATYDPRMRDLCNVYLQNWARDGGGLFVWYTAGASSFETSFGTWALTEDLAVDDTPKILALDDTQATAAPGVTIGAPVRGALDARRHIDRADDWQTADPHLRFLDLGESFEYLLRADEAGTHRVRLTMGSPDRGEPIGVTVNAGAMHELDAPATGAYNAFAPTTSAGITVREGLNAIRLTVLADRAYDVQSLEFACVADLDFDQDADPDDIAAMISAYISGSSEADADFDGDVDDQDLGAFVDAFLFGCG